VAAASADHPGREAAAPALLCQVPCRLGCAYPNPTPDRQGRLPAWVRLPASAALPFGAFEAVLAHESNAGAAAEFERAAGLGAGAAAAADPAALAAARAAVRRLRAPPALRRELLAALAAEGAAPARPVRACR